MDEICRMVIVRKQGRTFAARRYKLPSQEATEDSKKGKLKEVRQWIRETYPDLTRFDREDTDDLDVYEMWL
jgi:hypothetical protein